MAQREIELVLDSRDVFHERVRWRPQLQRFADVATVEINAWMIKLLVREGDVRCIEWVVSRDLDEDRRVQLRLLRVLLAEAPHRHHLEVLDDEAKVRVFMGRAYFALPRAHGIEGLLRRVDLFHDAVEERRHAHHTGRRVLGDGELPARHGAGRALCRLGACHGVFLELAEKLG